MRTFAHTPRESEQANSANYTKPGWSLSAHSPDVCSMLRLHQKMGNQAVQRLLPKRTVSPQPYSLSPPSNEQRATLGLGQPLEAKTRSYMGQRFGHDFGNVRVHTDAQAAQSAAALNARAYTIGDDIVFGPAQYAPGTKSGRSVIAHELAHVVQYRVAAARNSSFSGRSNASHPAERQARLAAKTVNGGDSVSHWRFEPATSQVHALDWSPADPSTAYLLDEAELAAELAALDAAGREARVTAVRDLVKTTWTRAEAAGLIDLLSRARTREREMATSPVRPVSSLPASEPTAYREHLMLDAGLSSGNRVGRDLVTGAKAPAAVSGTGAKAANAIVQLRRLDDTLRRALVARSVSSATGAAMGEVMALYRIEGDMSMPPSEASLTSGIPSGRSDAVTSLSPTPEISHLVVMFDPARVSGWTDDAIREFALLAWFVQIGGLDQVGLLPSPRESAFATWSLNNWTEAGRADTLVDAKKRWTDALAVINIKRLPSTVGASVAVAAQVTDPELLVSTVLQEAVMLQQRLKKTESLLGALPVGHARAGTHLSSGMAYLLYNAGTDQARAVVLSALVFGYEQDGSGLKASIDGDALLKAIITPLVATIRGMSKAEVISAAAANWTTINAWMTEPGNLELLSDFVEQTEVGVWPSWQEHRGNVSRFRVLEAYYLGL